ncbi:GTP 3',8-cyclase MoaA [Endozoicomonas euniceicola]|uniref:GTP 3',8-cyclase n=1 Tax=Endozoicomonas euniceicola TaxID=1234143 RepID=A0ABY6GRG9_9GAMM|nr:GTP 3',8-cyclase MoaA [Endozoicomonas euniceicola]UYM15167.1 GTP 3',8-cyclase MoaA [Endozoicomonas euniceicola]
MLRLQDNLGRTFPYLRLSITDLCNFRCNYCLPDGCEEHHHKQSLTVDEIRRLISAFARLGVEKVRITGGEPTLRHEFNDIVSTIKQIPGIQTVAMTTNGYRMDERIESWLKAGVDAINVSIDSLDARGFQTITGHDRLQEVLNGIKRGFQLGMPGFKVNAVLMRGHNADQLPDFLNWIKDQPITLRFIELMQTGDNQDFFNQQHLAGNTVREQLLNSGWVRVVRHKSAGPAQEYYHPDYRGRIGLITPYSPDFCDDCNRLRVSSLGKLQLCLFGDQGYDLRDLLQSDQQQPELINRIRNFIQLKQDKHFLEDGFTGGTATLAQIGG